MAFVEFLKEFDIEVVKLDWLDAACGWDAALLEPESGHAKDHRCGG